MLMKVKNDTPVKGLSESINKSLENKDDLEIQAIGSLAVNQMIKGIARANWYCNHKGKNITCSFAFTNAEVKQGDKKSAISVKCRIDTMN